MADRMSLKQKVDQCELLFKDNLQKMTANENYIADR